DAGIFEMQDAGEGAQQRGLTEPGDAFEQDVAAGQEADQDAFDNVILSDDDFADLLTDLVELRGCGVEGIVGGHVLILDGCGKGIGSKGVKEFREAVYFTDRICAVWWRPCQAYRAMFLSRIIGPSSGCTK